jgi:AcrR family transcriptional regulator
MTLPLRSDARLRRAEIFRAADQVFARHGITAPLDLVADRAGVGRATLYRNFPDRAALVTAMLERNLDALEAAAGAQPGDADPLSNLLHHTMLQLVESPALADAWRIVDPRTEAIRGLRWRLDVIFAGPVAHARAAGRLRQDFQADDVPTALGILGVLIREPDHDRRLALGERLLGLLDQGLRPRGAGMAR